MQYFDDVGYCGTHFHPELQQVLGFHSTLSLIGQELRILLAMRWLFVPRANLTDATRVLLFNRAPRKISAYGMMIGVHGRGTAQDQQAIGDWLQYLQ
jgi:hypothetical protein